MNGERVVMDEWLGLACPRDRTWCPRDSKYVNWFSGGQFLKPMTDVASECLFLLMICKLQRITSRF